MANGDRPASSASLNSALDQLQAQQTLPRIWRGDHTVWSQSPVEIVDRLGWLRAPDEMATKVAALKAFADEVRAAGFRHVVLLGMGGSSLGPEVFRRSFSPAPGYPPLIVLDSTVPRWLAAVDAAIDPKHTLFIVSSKSGTTIEPLSFYKHFRARVTGAVGESAAGASFVAITDPGTPLERMAAETGFRRVFTNLPDTGGRFSVLTFFGLVPAALMGLDVSRLLKRAKAAASECSQNISAASNPGATLGASVATMALAGKDKLTLVASRGIGGFGLWVEQLIAESLGKSGKGVVPVAGEPLLEPSAYGQDRFFVRLRHAGGVDSAQDAAVDRLEAAGHLVVRIEMADSYDLGYEFFRWEMAAAVAGAILEVHPFDQPDVQLAKDMTSRILKEPRGNVEAPKAAALSGLLGSAKPGDYVAILAYVRETPEMDQAITSLRRAIMERYRIATTAGYGPRYLHSTGQLHKGGPDSGLFFVITADQGTEMPVPGMAYSFNYLSQAQAMGDLRALAERGRRVAHLHLQREDADAMRALSKQIGSL